MEQFIFVQLRNTGEIAVLPVFRYGKIKRNSSIKIIKIILPPLLYDTKVNKMSRYRDYQWVNLNMD